MTILPQKQFHPKNVAKNLAKDAKETCQHFWINKRIHVIRDGFGKASKKIDQKCIFCGAMKSESKNYVDDRIRYRSEI